MYLQDRLKDLYYKSKLMHNLLASSSRGAKQKRVKIGSLVDALNVGVHDIPLLLSICTTYSANDALLLKQDKQNQQKQALKEALRLLDI
jgi:hypothetical protein